MVDRTFKSNYYYPCLRRDWFCGVTWERVHNMKGVLEYEFAYDRI